MFDTILIANRGEIACRVIRSARALGLRSVAVYSEADAGAAHVAMADQAVLIGGPRPADSYLRGERIIQAALDTGAQAIHPGYGFLSENPEFVDAVEAAGLVFIGPSASAIRAMGLKDAAKALMEKAGVPIVPGYMGSNQEPAHLQAAADKIGYPVLIKAVAGGGGKGMRLVERSKDFADALASAQGEASTAFGNAAVLIEKYIQQPRHIEVQVFGDGTNAVHLFERDCSLQRRHQKVIEEAPAPGMTAEMRAAMGTAAVRAAEAIGYKGAGTVEFIVDGSNGLRPDGFWFMEMNTRLQVEHPVTEAITGVDLVEWQLRVASGESLPCAQDDLTITGHAFEARLYAEDVPAGFLPATGTLSHLRFPADARIDSGVREGDTISPWYDPMIAKVITHGATRAIALSKLRAALEGTQVAGSVTNLAFLGALTRHQGFRAGEVDTGLIGRDLDALTAEPAIADATVALAALAAMGAGQGDLQGFALWTPLWQTVVLERGEARWDCAVARVGKEWAVRVGDATLSAERRAGAWWIDGQRAASDAQVVGNTVSVFGAHTVQFTRPDPLAVDADAGAGAGIVLAPMPGMVKAVFVNAGDVVEKGARLAILEAMKMEHTLTAGRDGTVAEVLAKAGQQVEAGAALIALAEEE
ncbi:acetyl/propionyl/methylcrotonyl-CoA carboxylase subunit alpha [Pararhodobacter zhoushanensis]|uniref:acetyl/propionyl/methylcrotonyl-CoA carboxylase subunit alpha n=1 Tax=Pararhodobacter zhoushanensis TaxID=2479545 RepID=UPI000F8D61EB|nr:acetyl/propionyl/methylcrotonyl-CoA carboxylase subunit alpha [Pararhodobacter zhoushanensis]